MSCNADPSDMYLQYCIDVKHISVARTMAILFSICGTGSHDINLPYLGGHKGASVKY